LTGGPGFDHRQVAQSGYDSTEHNVRIVLNIIGGLLLLMGTTWFLQGINVLPGSFMSGQVRWSVYGAVADGVALALLVSANRPRRDASTPRRE
jgi:hypothetical protein